MLLSTMNTYNNNNNNKNCTHNTSIKHNYIIENSSSDAQQLKSFGLIIKSDKQVASLEYGDNNILF